MQPGCIAGVVSSYSSDRSEYLQFCKLKYNFSFLLSEKSPWRASFDLSYRSFFLFKHCFQVPLPLSTFLLNYTVSAASAIFLQAAAITSPNLLQSVHFTSTQPCNLESEHLLLNMAFCLGILDYICCMHKARWLSAHIFQSFLFTHNTKSIQNFQNYLYAKLCGNFNSNWCIATVPDMNRQGFTERKP